MRMLPYSLLRYGGTSLPLLRYLPHDAYGVSIKRTAETRRLTPLFLAHSGTNGAMGRAL